MLNPLIHYELDMAHQYQGQLRRKALSGTLHTRQPGPRAVTGSPDRARCRKPSCWR